MFPQKVNINNLEETKSFYDKKLKDKKLTEKQRNSFLWAKESIDKLIEIEKYLKDNEENRLKKGGDDHN